MQNNLVECKDESKKNIKNVRDEGLDKFYTNVDYAKKCIDKLFELYDKSEFNLVIEPSAGNGSFFNQLDFADKIGIDILPDESLHDTNIIKMDFFDYKPHEDATNILVIGNPPFGRVSSIAIKFFNHAALFADFIAFIIPRTFRKLSVQNRLNNRFHLMYDEDVPIKPCIFTPKMTVKCCFQIWKKSDVVREVIKLPTTNVDWNFLPFGKKDIKNQPTPPEGADFAMRAYGGKIGYIKTDNLHELRPKSWHWFKSNIDKEELIFKFNQLNYSDSLNTARQNSMGRAELVKLYNESYL